MWYNFFMILEKYTVVLAGKERVFKNVKAKKSRLSGEIIISNKENKRLTHLLIEELKKKPQVCLSEEERKLLKNAEGYDQKN